MSFVLVALSCGIVLTQTNQGLGVFANLDSVNNSEVVTSNGSMQVIPNQYIVMLQNDTTDSDMQSVINELENRGAEIVGRYDELFQGFSFKTQDNQTAKQVVEFLEESPQVQSVTTDRQVSIQPQ